MTNNIFLCLKASMTFKNVLRLLEHVGLKTCATLISTLDSVLLVLQVLNTCHSILLPLEGSIFNVLTNSGSSLLSAACKQTEQS